MQDLGGVFPRDGLFTTATFVHFRALYANGVELICETEGDDARCRFEGTEGWVAMGPEGLTAEPQSLLTSIIGPNEIHLYQSEGHQRNFLDCIRTGGETAAPVEIGHRSATVCHLGNIAMMLKRKLRWDPDAERFLGDEQANRMLSKPMRSPWSL